MNGRTVERHFRITRIRRLLVCRDCAGSSPFPHLFEKAIPMRTFENMVNTYNFALAFCKTLLGCRYAWYETDIVLREFRKTYGVD